MGDQERRSYIQETKRLKMTLLPRLLLLAALLGTLLAVITISASAEELTDTTGAGTVEVPDISIPYGHSLYKLKLFIESLQEKLTTDELKLLKLQQAHMQNRIDELKYDAVYKNSQHTEQLLEKIQSKQAEINSLLDKLSESKSGEMIKAKGKDGEMLLVPVSDFIENARRNNYEVLDNLINDPRMPEQSMKGLRNAINKSAKTMSKEDLEANMVQGSFHVSEDITSLMPFERIAFLEPNEKKWYSVVVNSDSVAISEGQEPELQYLIYPSQRQIDELSGIISRLNKNKSPTGRDALKLSLLWWNVKKEKVN